jgi:hypothetical protein
VALPPNSPVYGRNSEAVVTVLRFKVSSYCLHGACVGVAPLEDGGVAVRDTKASDGPILTFSAQEWQAFVAGVKANEFEVNLPRE